MIHVDRGMGKLGIKEESHTAMVVNRVEFEAIERHAWLKNEVLGFVLVWGQ